MIGKFIRKSISRDIQQVDFHSDGTHRHGVQSVHPYLATNTDGGFFRMKMKPHPGPYDTYAFHANANRDHTRHGVMFG